MITTYVFEVSAVNGCALPWFAGYETRAAFLGMVRELVPDLAEKLHEGETTETGRKASVMSLKTLRFIKGCRPVWPADSVRKRVVNPYGLPVDANLLISPEAEGWFSVTVMNDEVARELLLPLSGCVGREISVKGCSLLINQVRVNVLNPEKLETPISIKDHTDLYFKTPTYFNPLYGDKKYKVLYPDPSLLMASLISTARRILGISLPKPVDLAEKIFYSGIDIRTPITKTKTPTPTGFIGWVKLRFKDGTNSEEKKLIIKLLKLAEITNIGGNRAAGYGELQIKTTQLE